MGDVIFTDIVDVGGRKFRKQSGSIGETIERSQRRRAAERTRAVRVAAEEDGDELFREEDDDDAGKEASVSEASRAVDETLAACDEDGFVQTAGGLWTCLVSADADLVRHVTAHDADAMRDLEKHHGATVILPSSNAGLMSGGIKPPAPGSIMLAVPSKRAAVDAKRDLESLTHRALRSPKLQYTHFVNIPLVLGVDGEALVGAIRAFTRHVLSSTYASGCHIDPAIVTEPGHAHLTLCMLKLYSDEARAKAVAAMASLSTAIRSTLGDPPARIDLTVKGLGTMNDDMSAVDVLFLKVHEVGGGEAVNMICDAAVRAFGDAGLLLSIDDKPVKLHATVMNTRLRRGRGDGERSGGRTPFDARRVMEAHGRLDCGTVRLTSVHLSRRGEFDVELGGFYRRVAECCLV